MTLKERLAAGQSLIGALLCSNSPDILEYAAAGLDWVWCEAQHTHADWSNLVHCVRTAEAVNMPALVRTWTHDTGCIERLLDTAATGIIVPMVDTPEQAARLVSHCYYPPIGNRSFGSARIERISPNIDYWNQRIVTVMMIETPLAVQNVEAIASVPGVDALLVGMRDLALRLGWEVDDYTAHLHVKDELLRVVEACQQANKAAAVLVATPEELVLRLGEGYRLICANADLLILAEYWQRMRQVFRSALDEKESHP
jgi:2-keto-3-deoxy-L-rhamnonate aldolase RhmA